MPRALVLQLGDAELPVHLEKVDRSKLYGYIETLSLDAEGRPCTLATIAGDGRTLIGAGGTATGYMTADGRWRERGRLTPIDPEGRVVEPVPSSFAAPVPLDQTASVEELLSHDIRLVYQLSSANPDEDDDAVASLREALADGRILAFPFSYRESLQADSAFLLLGSDGHVFMLVGVPTRMAFVGLEEAEGLAEVDETEADGDEDDVLDFGMI